jgi:broad specificity phosphatase PhoE
MNTHPTPASDALTSAPHCTSTLAWPTTREYILYFIRHGEALHNILEKAAETTVRQSLLQQGYDANSSYVIKAVDDARRAILNSESMEDPPLSELGIEEAKRAKRELEQLIRTLELPEVQEVWVSPLQRALKTASIIFPRIPSNDGGECNGECKEKCPRIKVIKELEERRTGLACDTCSPWKTMHRPSFQHFSLSGLRLDSMQN